MTPIPEDIKDKIVAEGERLFEDRATLQMAHMSGSVFGYSLRQQELENKIIELDRMADESHAAFIISEQENKKLEDAIKSRNILQQEDKQEIKELNNLLTLKESERQQWAELCVKKSKEIDKLNILIEKYKILVHGLTPDDGR